jgi:hypothetical protein
MAFSPIISVLERPSVIPAKVIVLPLITVGVKVPLEPRACMTPLKTPVLLVPSVCGSHPKE